MSEQVQDIPEEASQDENLPAQPADAAEQNASPNVQPEAESPDAVKIELLGDKKWYAVRTYAGHERKVKEHIDREAEINNAKDKLSEVHIPYEKFVEVKDGKKTSKTKNLFPGYVLVEAVLDKLTKSIILEAPSVVGFLGVKEMPMPLRPDEVRRLLAPEQEQEKRTAMKTPFEIGSSVKITDGPFNSLSGVVQEINAEKMKVKVMINFFGRSTPTEVDFSQVKLITA
ncbi:MAG: transcription termination/antitermination factor NusG [Rhizobacter sp.]|nr:transcription termination/antitermination factor NusG [Chlorobiales bacterium]